MTRLTASSTESPVRFWDLSSLQAPGDPACTDGAGASVSYGELAHACSDVAALLANGGSRQLGFIRCTNAPAWLVAYLACLQGGHVPLLLPSDLAPELIAGLTAAYRPAWIWHPPSPQHGLPLSGTLSAQAMSAFELLPQAQPTALHPDLGLLLSTSGSTGSPKLVRLSRDALDANAQSIRDYLGLTSTERALTTLPGSYSYGLSVVNSHLAARACLVLQNTSLFSRDFVQTVRDQRVSSLAGVPTWYQMLLRTGFDKADTPSVRTFTQAGGRLDERTKRAVLEMARQKAARFFVMYGQTEACARISYVPPEALPDHLDSIGIAIPGGRLSLDPETSEILYEGPNVMMGYAESRDDLAKPDECQGLLRTGDIGEVDAAGFFRITGRLKRFVKLSGNRYGLDEIEALIGQALAQAVAVVGRDERLGVWLESGDAEVASRAKALLQSTYQLHHSLFRVHLIEQLPLLSSGKKDYAALLAQLG